MLYPQNGDRIVTIDSVTSLHPMYFARLHLVSPPPEYCDKHVCVSVCPRAYLRNYTSRLHRCFVHIAFVTHGRGFLFWRRCDTLCISAFIYERRYFCTERRPGLDDAKRCIIRETQQVPAQILTPQRIRKLTCQGQYRTRDESHFSH